MLNGDLTRAGMRMQTVFVRWLIGMESHEGMAINLCPEPPSRSSLDPTPEKNWATT